jgi:hypothetical protein
MCAFMRVRLAHVVVLFFVPKSGWHARIFTLARSPAEKAFRRNAFKVYAASGFPQKQIVTLELKARLFCVLI